jgi:hypothetical protein
MHVLKWRLEPTLTCRHLLFEGRKNNSCQLVAVEEEEEENEERVDGRLRCRRGEEMVSTPWPIAPLFRIDGPHSLSW